MRRNGKLLVNQEIRVLPISLKRNLYAHLLNSLEDKKGNGLERWCSLTMGVPGCSAGKQPTTRVLSNLDRLFLFLIVCKSES